MEINAVCMVASKFQPSLSHGCDLDLIRGPDFCMQGFSEHGHALFDSRAIKRSNALYHAKLQLPCGIINAQDRDIRRKSVVSSAMCSVWCVKVEAVVIHMFDHSWRARRNNNLARVNKHSTITPGTCPISFV